ncbi:hypothetical protein GCM10007989_10630 [Devosia pacifica]|uniref:Anti-sigma K factor RskA C-terminal domain-containing protein n=1 Tax=Devosia pacifica TaxID=1335967 RepID=A0A918S052_9HYPH|nr:anti-sigma factor [Devosia pacifica]GHA17316.1 hypothetical protein GCM10007989_10630 [Devosia pacifica]
MTREGKQAAAGDYVLGTMNGPELRAFEQELASDPELAHLVADLSDRMLSLDNVSETEAPAALWARIEAALDNPATDEPQTTVVPISKKTSQQAPGTPWMALAACAVVALGFGYILGATTLAPPEPRVIAVLLDETSASPAVIVEAFGDDSVHLVPLETFEVPQGQVLEVWTLPDAETGPVSLGTLDETREAMLTGPDLPEPQPGQLYEITLEQAPGSPTGRPTGPILVKGFARNPVL